MMRGMTDDADRPLPSQPLPSDSATSPSSSPSPDHVLDRRGLFLGGASLVAGAALAACGKREEPKPAPPAPSPNAKAMGELADKVKKQEAAAETQPGVELVELT